MKISYTIQKSVQTIDDAMAENAPLVYAADQIEQASSAAEGGGGFPAPWEGNLRGPSRLDFFCDPEKAEERIETATMLARAHEEEYFAHAQSHSCLEPHACVASWADEADSLSFCGLEFA